MINRKKLSMLIKMIIFGVILINFIGLNLNYSIADDEENPDLDAWEMAYNVYNTAGGDVNNAQLQTWGSLGVLNLIDGYTPQTTEEAKAWLDMASTYMNLTNEYGGFLAQTNASTPAGDDQPYDTARVNLAARLYDIRNSIANNPDIEIDDEMERQMREVDSAASQIIEIEEQNNDNLANTSGQDVADREQQAAEDEYGDDTPEVSASANGYQRPGLVGQTDNAEESIEDVFSDANSFLSEAENQDEAISDTNLQSFSRTFFNIFFEIGVIVTVIVGIILGIKFITSSTEEKANVKEALVPYVVGCIIVYGAFGIWKLAITLLQGV